MARMTMGQWRKQLGEAVAFEQAPGRLGLPAMELLRAVKTGKVPLHTFRAADGRVFRMVKTRDVQQYRSQGDGELKPQITMQGMKAAFREMAQS